MECHASTTSADDMRQEGQVLFLGSAHDRRTDAAWNVTSDISGTIRDLGSFFIWKDPFFFFFLVHLLVPVFSFC